MSRHHHEFSIGGMCRAVGVARSGYDAWRAQGGLNRSAQRDAILTEPIRHIFDQRGQTYGRPRVYAALKAQGIGCSRHRVARLMRQAALNASPPRRRVRTTQAAGQVHSAGNRLERDFTAQAPNRKWLVDITAIQTDEGRLYLAGVLDLFSRRLVGWAMDEPMPAELTQEALEMASLQRQPPDELLHHADQGSPYTSDAYQALLANHHRLARFSAVGCCYDNAPLESFWATLKTDLVYRQHYHPRAQAKNAIFAYIQGWYNRQPRHSTLGYLSPAEFEQQFQA
jgi:putative transposase